MAESTSLPTGWEPGRRELVGPPTPEAPGRWTAMVWSRHAAAPALPAAAPGGDISPAGHLGPEFDHSWHSPSSRVTGHVPTGTRIAVDVWPDSDYVIEHKFEMR
jgi:hypothetical protein